MAHPLSRVQHCTHTPHTSMRTHTPTCPACSAHSPCLGDRPCVHLRGRCAHTHLPLAEPLDQAALPRLRVTHGNNFDASDGGSVLAWPASAASPRACPAAHGTGGALAGRPSHNPGHLRDRLWKLGAGMDLSQLHTHIHHARTHTHKDTNKTMPHTGARRGRPHTAKTAMNLEPLRIW
jgi:hypothetical protein